MIYTRFSETQRYTQPWVWITLIIVFAVMVFAFIRFIRSENPKNINPFFFLVFLLPIGFLFSFKSMRLETRIDRSGIYYRFYPFRLKESKVDWENVDKAYIRDYKPLKEYGGWGIRGVNTNEALNVRGKKGLQLILKNGNKLLIGTQRPDDIRQLLEQYSQNHIIDSLIIKNPLNF